MIEGEQTEVREGLCPLGGQAAERGERRDAAERRARILEAARALFAAKGVDATTMHEIAQAARVGQGTLYRRYAHKGDLCSALLGDNIARFRQAVADGIAAEGLTPLGRLEALLRLLVGFNEANGPLLGAIEDAACGGRRGELYRGPMYAWLHSLASSLLAEAVAVGEASLPDAAGAADVVLATLAIDMYLHQRESGYTPEQIGDLVCHTLLQGLRRR